MTFSLSQYGTNPHAGINMNADNGWGSYKWPQGVPAELLGSFKYTFKSAKTTTATITLRKELVTLAQLSLQIADALGYPVYGSPNPSNEPTWGPWSYENRPIGGTSTASNHSRGRAMDWNAPRDPQSHTFSSDMPPALVAHMESIGWYWGGRYSAPTKFDTMHFEYAFSPANVSAHEAKARQILASLSGSKPSPVVPVVPPKPKAPVFPLPSGYYFGPKSGPKSSVSGYFSHRDDLKRWQAQANKKFGTRLTVDGLYGPATASAAKTVQSRSGLKVDALIGPATWNATW